MPYITTIYYGLTVASMLFHIEQIIFLIVIYEDKAGFKFRFARIKGHGNLRPVANTAKIALFIFTTTLVIFPIAGIFLYDDIVKYAQSLEYNFLILLSAFFGVFFSIGHYMVKKGWNRAQVILLTISFVLMSIVLGLNYHDDVSLLFEK